MGPLAAAAALSLGSMPAFAQTAPATTSASDCSAIKFELANPAPGARVELGSLVLQGIAQDTRATQSQGLGIDRIDFFLDNRDQGGLSLGTAVPGMVTGPFGPNSFQTTITFPEQIGGHDLVAYAHSSVTGQVETLSIPIVLGEDPSKVSQSVEVAGVTTCTGGSQLTTTPSGATAPVSQPTTPATTTTPSTTTTAPAATSSSTMTLNIGNPSAGDTIKVGAFSISGDAMDKAASTGSGVDRIDVFLDNRDMGGMFLGSAQLGPTSFWQATVTLPNNQTGLHELWFYAHSSVTGATTTSTVQVTIEK
jgi:hypothetical protein